MLAELLIAYQIQGGGRFPIDPSLGRPNIEQYLRQAGSVYSFEHPCQWGPGRTGCKNEQYSVALHSLNGAHGVKTATVEGVDPQAVRDGEHFIEDHCGQQGTVNWTTIRGTGEPGDLYSAEAALACK